MGFLRLNHPASQMIDDLRARRLPPDFADVQNAFRPAFRAVVVESEKLVRELVVDMLTGEGFEVEEYERPEDLDRHLEGKMAIERADLFVIDLGRGRKEEAEALNLIYTINRIKTKAGLMAMSEIP